MKPELLLVRPIYEPAMAELERDFTLHMPWTAPDPGAYVRLELMGSVQDFREARSLHQRKVAPTPFTLHSGWMPAVAAILRNFSISVFWKVPSVSALEPTMSVATSCWRWR